MVQNDALYSSYIKNNSHRQFVVAVCLRLCVWPRADVAHLLVHEVVVEGRRYIRGNHIIGRHGDVQVKVRLRVHVLALATARRLSEGENIPKKQSALCLVPPSPRGRFSVDALGAAPAGFVR